MTAALPILAAAVDRLNSYVRTREADAHFGLKPHVYRLKSFVMGAADAAGATMRRRIVVDARCNSCYGSGKWGRRNEPCWTCKATGIKQLYFIETRIGKTLRCLDWPLADMVWHTPYSMIGYGAETAEKETDWKPLTPGNPLTIDEMVTALNAAEDAVSEIALLNHGTITICHPRHTLYLGKEQGFCTMCGDAADLKDDMGQRGLLLWHCQICESCHQHQRLLSERYGWYAIAPHLPIPVSLLTPAIEQWIKNRGGRAAVLKADPDRVECYA